MKRNTIRYFVKESYKNFIISLAVVAVLCLLFQSFVPVFWFLISISRQYYHYDVQLAERKRLAAKGLTEEDVINIQFVKKWEENHSKGRLRYAFFDGIIGGLTALIPVSGLLYYLMYSGHSSERLFDEFGDMMGFIGYSILLSIAIGIVYHYYLWPFRERRFQQLVDPLSIALNS